MFAQFTEPASLKGFMLAGTEPQTACSKQELQEAACVIASQDREGWEEAEEAEGGMKVN